VPASDVTANVYVHEHARGGIKAIHHFPIARNALCLPPKFCINHRCEILLGGLHIPKSIPQQQFMQNPGGGNRVHYGELENKE